MHASKESCSKTWRLTREIIDYRKEAITPDAGVSEMAMLVDYFLQGVIRGCFRS